MNMVPFILDQSLMKDMNESNFLQPIEILDSQSFCDISLPFHDILADILKRIYTTETEKYGILEHFIQELSEE